MQTSYLLRKHNFAFHLYLVIRSPEFSSILAQYFPPLLFESLSVCWICVNKQGIDLTSAGRGKLLAPNERAPYYKSAGTFVVHFVVLAPIRVNRREILGTWVLSGRIPASFGRFRSHT